MRRFIVEATIGTAIALVLCYLASGWSGVVGGVLGCIIAAGLLARDYRRR